MIDPKSATIIPKDKVPEGKLISKYTFLRDMGAKLTKEQAIQLKADDATEAKRIQSRWRSYFKKNGHSRREVFPDGKIMVYLWRES